MPTPACTLRLTRGTDATSRIRRVFDVGFASLGIEPPFHFFQAEEVTSMVRRGSIASIRLFLPYPRTLRLDDPCPFRLGSGDREAESDAVKYGSETILFAERHSIPVVLLPAGIREVPGQAALSSYLRTLERLLELAHRYGVRLAVSPAVEGGGIPLPEEAERCYREFRGAPLCSWPDPAAEASSSRRVLWRRFSADLAGVTLSLGGRSTVRDWEAYSELLEAAPVRLVDPPPAPGGEGLEQGFELLETLTRGPANDPFV